MPKASVAEPSLRKPLLPADRPEQGGPDPIPFDRRRTPRDPAIGAVMASFVSEQSGITLARAELRDASVDGAGLRCPVSVEPGTRFSLHRSGVLAAERGVVTRCIAAKDSFLLGLKFEARMGAAA